MAKTGVKITVKDASGVELGSFMAQEGKTIAQMAEENSVDIPISCGAGHALSVQWKCFLEKSFWFKIWYHHLWWN